MFFAETIDRVHQPVRGQRGKPRSADLIDEALTLRREFGRQRVQAEKCFLDRYGQILAELPRHLERAALGRQFQSIARFDLDGRDAFRHQALEPRRRRFVQRFLRRRASVAHGRLDAAARSRNLLIGCAAESLLELRDTIAAVDQVRVAVDQARRDPLAARRRASTRPAPRARRRPSSAVPSQAMRSPVHRKRGVLNAAVRRRRLPWSQCLRPPTPDPNCPKI